MAENHLVRCSTKQSGDRARVTHIGGTNSDGTAWKMTEAEALAGIKSGKLKFYVNVESDGKSRGIWLGVDQKQGRECLTTTGEGADPSALLGLPDCP
ncbi:MAG TPA: DUF3892 domain-containing protein [Gemmatimonadales bacterium]|jgi:hypothetical protein